MCNNNQKDLELQGKTFVPPDFSLQIEGELFDAERIRQYDEVFGVKNLYRLTQNQLTGYNYYESFVIIAKSEEEARSYRPDGKLVIDVPYNRYGENKWPSDQQYIECKLIATDLQNCENGIVDISFYNA